MAVNHCNALALQLGIFRKGFSQGRTAPFNWGRSIHTQVSQNDIVFVSLAFSCCTCFNFVNHAVNLCDWIRKSHTLNIFRVRFCSCLRSGHPNHDKLITFYILILVHNGWCLEHTGIVGIGISTEKWEIEDFFVFFSLIQAKVKFMVSDRHSIIADFIENLRAFFPFGAVRNWQTLESISCIYNQCLRIFRTFFLDNCCKFGISDNTFFFDDTTVHIVCMKNGSFRQACVRRSWYILSISCDGRIDAGFICRNSTCLCQICFSWFLSWFVHICNSSCWLNLIRSNLMVQKGRCQQNCRQNR